MSWHKIEAYDNWTSLEFYAIPEHEELDPRRWYYNLKKYKRINPGIYTIQWPNGKIEEDTEFIERIRSTSYSDMGRRESGRSRDLFVETDVNGSKQELRIDKAGVMVYIEDSEGA